MVVVGGSVVGGVLTGFGTVVVVVVAVVVVVVVRVGSVVVVGAPFRAGRVVVVVGTPLVPPRTRGCLCG